MRVLRRGLVFKPTGHWTETVRIQASVDCDNGLIDKIEVQWSSTTPPSLEFTACFAECLTEAIRVARKLENTFIGRLTGEDWDKLERRLEQVFREGKEDELYFLSENCNIKDWEERC